SAVARNTAVAFTFNKAANPSTLTAITSGSCGASSLQLLDVTAGSACVPMLSATPTASNGNRTFTLQPAAALAPSHTFKFRVTTAAKDLAGVALANPFTSSSGFTSDVALIVTSSAPTGTGVALNASISVIFNKAASPLSAITSGTSCGTSTLQL